MKKLLTLGILLQTVLYSFSEIDTLQYPRQGVPNELITDSCVLFTSQQTEFAAEDGLDADFYKKEVIQQDTVIANYELFLKEKQREVDSLKRKNELQEFISSAYRQKSDQAIDLFKKADAALEKAKSTDRKWFTGVGVTLVVSLIVNIVLLTK